MDPRRRDPRVCRMARHGGSVCSGGQAFAVGLVAFAEIVGVLSRSLFL